MKISGIWVATIALLLVAGTGVAKADPATPPAAGDKPAAGDDKSTGTVFQTVAGDKLHSGDGKNAVQKGDMEVKKVDGAQSESGQVARTKGSNGQWSFVVGWFGMAAPEGKSIVRLRIYVDGQKAAKCLLYTRSKDGTNDLAPLKIPADAKEKTFVTVDVPVNAKAEWSGLVIKKAEKSDVPGPWIDTVSVVLPD